MLTEILYQPVSCLYLMSLMDNLVNISHVHLILQKEGSQMKLPAHSITKQQENFK